MRKPQFSQVLSFDFDQYLVFASEAVVLLRAIDFENCLLADDWAVHKVNRALRATDQFFYYLQILVHEALIHFY